ncbi:MAG: response regulator [Myxococcales bacterium]|nr:response regulator [Myxococcales bacterium]
MRETLAPEASSAEQEVLAAGARIDGRYCLDRPLGAGSQADVWRARDIHLERHVALKILRGDGISDGARFRREAAMLARLRSAHLATIYAFGFVDREPYFAMELIEGRSLFELWMVHVQAQRAMPVARTVDIIAAAARGLSVAHAQGIVHRDVKPENIMIEDDTGRVVLVDFGVALDSHGPNDGMIYGTPEYMAPELLGGAPASANTDQYGLALVAYELLTGALPFHEDPPFRQIPRRGKEPVPPPSSARPELARLDDVLLRALSIDPAARYPTCVAFGNALVEALSEAPLEPAATDGGLRVLVVDDDPLFVRLVTRCLHVALAGVPITIRRVTEPHAALEKCRTHLPELVVLDYEMPGMDGVELLARVRALPRGETVRAIVLSGNNDEQTRLRFAMLGVRTFAAKPIDFSALVETLHLVARANGWIAAGAS